MKLVRTLLASLCISSTIIAAENCYEPGCSSSCLDGLEFFAEYLYWKPVQDQMQYAAIIPGGAQKIIQAIQSRGPTLSEKITIKDPAFKWKSGFRLGVGYEFPSTEWDLQFYWTHLHEKINSHISDPESGIFPLTNPLAFIVPTIVNASSSSPENISFANEANSNWRFDYDIMDLQLGRSFLCCQSLIFHPFIGLKGASIKQKQNISYNGLNVLGSPLAVKNDTKNHFRAIGPSIGVDAAWEFIPCWSLSAGISAALLVGKFDVATSSAAGFNTFALDIDIDESKKHRIRPTVDAHFDLDWNTSICDWQIALGVGYEIQYWWNQWQESGAGLVGTLTGGSTASQGDLMMHGLTVHAAWMF